MRGQTIPEVCTRKDQTQTTADQEQNAGPAVPAIPKENSESTERSYGHGEDSMDLFLRR
jgi:hypothetical protein